MKNNVVDSIVKKYKVIAKKEGKILSKTAIIEARSKYECKQKAYRLFPDYENFEFVEIKE